VIPKQKFTNLLIEWLNTELGSVSNGFGDHEAPPRSDETKGWGIVYTITGGHYDDSGLFDEYNAGAIVYQVTSVGRTRKQAEYLADRVRALMYDLSGGKPSVPAPDGWVVAAVQPDEGSPGVDRAGEAPRVVFNVPERFTLRVSRA
jgi:hypothetical protein